MDRDEAIFYTLPSLPSSSLPHLPRKPKCDTVSARTVERGADQRLRWEVAWWLTGILRNSPCHAVIYWARPGSSVSGVGRSLHIHWRREGTEGRVALWGIASQSALDWERNGLKEERGVSIHDVCARILLTMVRVRYSDSHPTLYLVHGRSKPVCRGLKSTHRNLFHQWVTTYRSVWLSEDFTLAVVILDSWCRVVSYGSRDRKGKRKYEGHGAEGQRRERERHASRASWS